MPRLDFWYEFASTYSYLSAMRIEGMAADAGVEVRWRPFLLGPFFRAQGWKTSPFREQKEKGRYMARDMERICAARGLKFTMPDNFPQNGLSAARIALVASGEGWAGPFTRAVYQAEYGEGRDIAQEDILIECIERAGKSSGKVLAHIYKQDVKDSLRDQTDEAMLLGIFGAPTFICEDGEMFWGDDRLEQAIEWARRRSLSAS
jgi:2-hydroxychromene-2-carboxylate isomerase